MKASRKRRLILSVTLTASLGLVAGLILYALRQNVSLFYSPTQIVNNEAPLHHIIRAGGVVQKGSLVREKNSLSVHFLLTDFKNTIEVSYEGSLPDLFREGQGVVAFGQLIDDKHFKAREILAKHDENYMPPEVKSALEKNEVG
ncbi:cytochrome c-type biogenesis protein CcmE (plasmid) [Legionella adelaidensis]|uniref:Cytochrome c-type biogenesis protein CcmE n=1 Tax=Legionella adelaidensis TaxID=45056 RepID=A0A0W0R4A2_9GAMM|nr:cytochrome c maturation protein CcmE [Legionella adelaidensis]KTC65908.1 cytochrome c-type biogenesis protein CcmE [Legionella adelaidensis]VEH85528.1 cytochrome c-type biogenesis protein CcmE [Legionella adelaidensis]